MTASHAAPPEAPSVLLVDDRPENLLALTAVLEPLELRLVTAGSGEEALRALLAEDFAVVLLDVQMPGMDGFETAEYIRGRERSARTPIIFLTAVSTDMSQVLRGYEAGAVDYVLKPFDPVVLRSKVAVFAELDRHRRARERADELLRRAWASSPAGMALVDPTGLILRANPALTALLGSDGTAVGSVLAERFHPDDRAALAALGERALRAGAGPATEELRLALGDDEVPVAVVAAPVRDAQGDAQSLLLQLEDLRERRASQAALARAAAERAARDEAEALAGRLARVAALTDGLDALALSELVDELCLRLHEVLGARGAAVRVLDPAGAVVAAAERGAAEHAGRALRQALVEGDGAVELDNGALGVPLRAAGELFGAVGVSGSGAGAPEGQRVALVAHAAERAALIIRRALLLEREQHVASTLQHDLLPHSLPELPGVSVAAHFRAGGHGIEVGGDWYDVIPLSGGRVGLVVGDVAGRGVAAAARMGQLRSVARAYALEGHAPAAFAQRMNLYHRALSPDDLTTIVYAVIEPDRERLRFVNAGHPPPLFMPARGAPMMLTGVTPPLGVSDLPVHPETVVDFPPGAALVLYTDGLIERRGEGVDCGLQRLIGAASTVGSDRSVETLRDRVVESCLGPSSGDDDVTALFVRTEAALGPSARFTLSPDGESLGALRRMLRRWLAEAGASDDDTAAVTMAANEAWENAIEHAHAFAPVPISVAFERRQDDVYITVHDAGAPPGESDPDRGRGLALMQALMDEASFSFGGRYGGSVVLRRRLGGAQPGATTAGQAAWRTAG
ncbi:MAG TPA: SpoIIE family protein phosphatase [Solirubrobacteraceae bacterium]|nr:SpoIIE family protein phosphatase [Solirubrobacteraceae bacterium]